MSRLEVKFNKADLRAFKIAIRQNPQRVRKYAQIFFTKSMREFNKEIIRNPWEVGQSGGGAPVDTGRLRDTHKREIKPWEAKIYPTARYAPFVHEGTTSMEERPWLDYAFDQAQDRVQKHADDMLKKTIKGLAD